MQKNISCLLCIFMILSFINIPVFSQGETESRLFLEAIEMLNFLEVMPLIELDEFDRTSEVSRIQFAEYMCRALNLDEFGFENKTFFPDVAKSHWGSTCVSALVQTGIISTGELFRPDDTITLTEACKILMHATGYNHYADMHGGYPAGYLSAAYMTDIIPDSAKEKLTAYDVAIMLFNTLNIDVFEAVSINDDGVSYKVQKGETLLWQRKNIYAAEAKFNGFWGFSLNGLNKPNKNQVLIGEQIYDISCNFNEDDLLGKNVKFYCRTQDEDNGGDIIYITDYYSNDDDIIIQSDNFDCYEDYQFKYFSDGGNKRCVENVSKSAIFVINHSIVKTEISRVFSDFYKGNIILRDTDNNGTYDLVIVNSYQSCIVGTYDSERNVIYFDNGSYPSIDLNSYEMIRFLSNDGQYLNDDTILSGSLLTVSMASDKSIIRINVSNNESSGILRAVSFDVTNSLEIGDAVLILDEKYSTFVNDKLKIGESYTYKLDMFGEIGFIKEADTITEKIWGYLYKADVGDGINRKVMVRIYNMNNENLILEFSGRIEIDGKMYKDGLTALKALPGAVVGENVDIERQLVKYSLNADGKINEIDTYLCGENESAENTVVKIADKTSVYLNRAALRFLRKIVVNPSSSLVFCVPDSSDVYEDEYFEVSNKFTTVFPLDGYYVISAYKTNNESPFDIIVYERNKEYYSLNSASNMLVDKVTEAINDKGETGVKISGLIGGVMTSYFMSSSSTVDTGQLECGDIIRFSRNAIDEIMNLEIVYKAENSELPTWAGVTATDNLFNPGIYYNEYQISYGYVTKKLGNVVWWGYKHLGDLDECYDFSRLPIMVYDSERTKNNVYVGNINDILDYETVGNACSRVFFQSSNTLGKSIIIYK